ncbi:hypothetical protein QTP88_028404 [Uroleucon formosanum]
MSYNYCKKLGNIVKDCRKLKYNNKQKSKSGEESSALAKMKCFDQNLMSSVKILQALGHLSKGRMRGFDGVGNLANILFGTCDNDCIEINSNKVLQLQRSEKAALNIILKSQTTVTSVTKTVLKQTEQIYYFMTFLRNKINEFMADSRNTSDKLINKTVEVEHKSRLHDSYLLLNVLFSQYAFETNYISEKINLARPDQIHTGVWNIIYCGIAREYERYKIMITERYLLRLISFLIRLKFWNIVMGVFALVFGKFWWKLEKDICFD